MKTSSIEDLCTQKGVRMTGQRRIIAQVLDRAFDHPDVEELYRRSVAIDENISIATVYRTVKLLEEFNIIERHDFRDGRSRYEPAPEDHHDHLIDLKSGKVIEFTSIEIEKLQVEIARKLGFKLVDHRLELYGIPLVSDSDGEEAE
ncbi:MAG: transcriptional repressor [Hyphomicrobiales bacterium]|nr:transcriptional repressor [Hyphomicrobiales bacterium]